MSAMSVNVRIPTTLRPLTAGAASITTEGATVADVLADLEARHPGMRERVLDESGAVRRFVNVFLDDEDVRFLDGPATAVPAGSTVAIGPQWPAAPSATNRPRPAAGGRPRPERCHMDSGLRRNDGMRGMDRRQVGDSGLRRNDGMRGMDRRQVGDSGLRRNDGRRGLDRRQVGPHPTHRRPSEHVGDGAGRP